MSYKSLISNQKFQRLNALGHLNVLPILEFTLDLTDFHATDFVPKSRLRRAGEEGGG